MCSEQKTDDDTVDAQEEQPKPKCAPLWVMWFCGISTLLCLTSTIARYAYDAYHAPDISLIARTVYDLPEGTYVITDTWPSEEKGTLYLLMGIVGEKMRVYPIRCKEALPDAFELKRSKGIVEIMPRNIRVFAPQPMDIQAPQA